MTANHIITMSVESVVSVMPVPVTATYKLVREYVERYAAVNKRDLVEELEACDKDLKIYCFLSDKAYPKGGESVLWRKFLAHALGDKIVLENLLLATVLYSRKNSVSKALKACDKALKMYCWLSGKASLQEAKEGLWCDILAQELSNKNRLESLLLATVLYIRKDSVSKASLGQGVLDICVQMKVKYARDRRVFYLANEVISEITSAVSVHS